MHMLIIGVKSRDERAMRSRVDLRATPLRPICSLFEAAGLATLKIVYGVPSTQFIGSIKT